MNTVDLTLSAPHKQPGPGRLVFTLTFAAALSGLAISGAYQITKPIIDANNAAELKESVFRVVPGSTQLQKLEFVDDRLVPIAEDAVTTGEVVYGAYDDEAKFLGYAIEGAGAGFQDTIRLLYGYDPETERVTGMWVLESRETPGLGDKIWKDEEFVANFDSLVVEPPITVVKGGADAENEVDAITGATISSKAVVSIINKSNERWLERLPGADEAPALMERTGATPQAADAPESPEEESNP